jgi:hypothetical protein
VDDDDVLTMVERRPFFETSDEELEALAEAMRKTLSTLGTSAWDEDLKFDCATIVEGITLDGRLPLVEAFVQSMDVVLAEGVFHPTTNNYNQDMCMAPEDVMNLSYASNMMTFTCLYEDVFRMMGRVPYLAGTSRRFPASSHATTRSADFWPPTSPHLRPDRRRQRPTRCRHGNAPDHGNTPTPRCRPGNAPDAPAPAVKTEARRRPQRPHTQLA